MKKKSLARVAVFAAAGLLGVVSAFWGSNGDAGASHSVTTAVTAASR